MAWGVGDMRLTVKPKLGQKWHKNRQKLKNRNEKWTFWDKKSLISRKISEKNDFPRQMWAKLQKKMTTRSQKVPLETLFSQLYSYLISFHIILVPSVAELSSDFHYLSLWAGPCQWPPLFFCLSWSTSMTSSFDAKFLYSLTMNGLTLTIN